MSFVVGQNGWKLKLPTNVYKNPPLSVTKQLVQQLAVEIRSHDFGKYDVITQCFLCFAQNALNRSSWPTEVLLGLKLVHSITPPSEFFLESWQTRRHLNPPNFMKKSEFIAVFTTAHIWNFISHKNLFKYKLFLQTHFYLLLPFTLNFPKWISFLHVFPRNTLTRF